MKVRAIRAFVFGDKIVGRGAEVELDGEVPDNVLACVEILDTKMAAPLNKARKPSTKKVKSCQ